MVEGDGWRASVECDMTGEEWLGTVLVGKRNASLLCWKGEMMATADFEEDQSQQTVSQTTSQTTSRPPSSITKRDNAAKNCAIKYEIYHCYCWQSHHHHAPHTAASGQWR
mmetsp:Transcript_7784/g.13259  ORF Transcript_7784/g.13259 Transcript_7784/m.13259 type:complete len:110 (+) Transcript_7784:1846-2175(+)